tara:strand:- start:180 stop:419 length:240 start_codon:yes stop_codon:yes gene_type:complete
MKKLNTTSARVISINGNNANEPTAYAVEAVAMVDGDFFLMPTLWHNSKTLPRFDVGDTIIVADIKGKDGKTRPTLLGKA